MELVILLESVIVLETMMAFLVMFANPFIILLTAKQVCIYYSMYFVILIFVLGCDDTDTCNAKGTCNATGLCECNYPFTGIDCNSCVDNLYTASCDKCMLFIILFYIVLF